MRQNAETLRSLYTRRFADTAAYRNRVWRVLACQFFSRWIGPSDTVLDVGCGYGEFINNVPARRKLAMDLNPDASTHLGPDVELLSQDCSSDWPLPDGSIDVIFTSNFLEHLPDKASVRQTLHHAIRCLRPGGLLIAMGPNARCLPGRYWDFFDHHVSLTERSMAEVLQLEGFVMEQIVPRFLPYTLVNAHEYPTCFVACYVRLPWLWWVAGKQFLVIARKPSGVRAVLYQMLLQGLAAGAAVA